MACTTSIDGVVPDERLARFSRGTQVYRVPEQPSADGCLRPARPTGIGRLALMPAVQVETPCSEYVLAHGLFQADHFSGPANDFAGSKRPVAVSRADKERVPRRQTTASNPNAGIGRQPVSIFDPEIDISHERFRIKRDTGHGSDLHACQADVGADLQAVRRQEGRTQTIPW